MKEIILKALRMKYQGQIAEAKANIEVYLTRAVGVGDHPDIITSVDGQMEIIAEAEDKLVVLDTHYTVPKI